jgi:hypothetical protein
MRRRHHALGVVHARLRAAVIAGLAGLPHRAIRRAGALPAAADAGDAHGPVARPSTVGVARALQTADTRRATEPTQACAGGTRSRRAARAAVARDRGEREQATQRRCRNPADDTPHGPTDTLRRRSAQGPGRPRERQAC